ncbi:MAG: NTP transferase domain-containing protein [Candidatus Eremiobacteraeota bacterium]|nr:NTP transferase domain-containing protein [Candidatus Eremiobacteraeota bacterium]
MMFDAAIMAGGRVDGEFAARIGTSVKALATVRGSTLLGLMIEALRVAGVGRVAVVGGEEARTACAHLVERFVDETADGAENLHRALLAWPGAPVVLASSDLPYVHGDDVREFLSRAEPAAIGFPLANASEYERKFPESAPHSTALRGDRVVNGSLCYVPPGSGPLLDAVAQKFFRVRKNALRMALLLGPNLLLRYAMKRLTIADLERRAERMVGVRATAVGNSAPSLCYDIDSIEDYAYALEHS